MSNFEKEGERERERAPKVEEREKERQKVRSYYHTIAKISKGTPERKKGTKLFGESCFLFGNYFSGVSCDSSPTCP